MPNQISESDTQQLQRTIEMFEAITESQSEDYQSLEILKEAYSKLNRREDFLRISKKLAAVYVHLGQISQGLLEFEGILQEYPQDADARAAVRELEAKNATLHAVVESEAPSSAKDSKPKPPAPVPGAGAGVPPSDDLRGKCDSGDQALANILIAEKLVTSQAVQPMLQRLSLERAATVAKGQSLTLLQLLVEAQSATMEELLSLAHTKSSVPFMPLAFCDVEREVGALLPKELALQYCVVPFDRISRSVLIATANPFDSAVRDMVCTMLNYHVFWYLSPPADIVATIRRVHQLDEKRSAAKRPATTS